MTNYSPIHSDEQSSTHRGKTLETKEGNWKFYQNLRQTSSVARARANSGQLGPVRALKWLEVACLTIIKLTSLFWLASYSKFKFELGTVILKFVLFIIWNKCKGFTYNLAIVFGQYFSFLVFFLLLLDLLIISFTNTFN